MHSLRAFIRQFRVTAMALLVLALLVKAAVPAGFMVAPLAEKILTVTVCADASGGHLVRQIAIPMKPGQGKHAPSPSSDSKDGSCLYSSLSMAAFGGLPPALLALALALAVLLGLAPLSRLTFSASRNLRPPLRGPPPTALIA